MTESSSVLIVGGGLTGLACARYLVKRGISCQVFEASEEVGGRVRSDRVDGFTLDRGFQVFLEAYPEALEILDYQALDFRSFEPGAVVRRGGHWHRLTDPWRRPISALGSLFGGVGSFSDKLKIAKLRDTARQGTLEELFERPETSTQIALERFGFSPEMINGFFRPFLGGIFLDRDLAVSSRMLEFVFRMMAVGPTSVPAAGMGAIPQQIADSLPEGTLRLNTAVDSVTDGEVRIGGERVQAQTVVVATDRAVAAELVNPVAGADASGEGSLDPGSWNGSTCLYFAAPSAPRKGHLFLNGEAGTGRPSGLSPSASVNSVAVMSQVASEYAPEGQELISVSIVGVPELGGDALAAHVLGILKGWFGPQVDAWRHLASYPIPHSLPRFDHRPIVNRPEPRRLGRGLLVAGDWTASPSIQGALVAGRAAAEAVLDGR